MAVKRVHLLISGRVQGVYYRATAREVARRLGLTGWVRNMPDGRVEAVAEGEEEKLREFIHWCNQGPPAARVEAVAENWSEATGEFREFSIRYY